MNVCSYLFLCQIHLTRLVIAQKGWFDKYYQKNKVHGKLFSIQYTVMALVQIKWNVTPLAKIQTLKPLWFNKLTKGADTVSYLLLLSNPYIGYLCCNDQFWYCRIILAGTFLIIRQLKWHLQQWKMLQMKHKQILPAVASLASAINNLLKICEIILYYNN